MKLLDNPQGNYQFLTGIAPYSSGAVAAAGYEIVHATLQRPLPYRSGFELIDRHLTALGRARNALCGIELRSPRPFTFAGFTEFNQGYQKILADWGLLIDGHNPIARTNIAPEVGAPSEPSLYAFSYTVPTDESSHSRTFVVAGAGDLREGTLSPDAIVRPDETSAEALSEKAAYVMQMMQARLTGLQVTWANITAVDIYTAHPLHSYLAVEILEKMEQAALHGVHWFYSRPPILGLEFEMDMRGTRHEIWIDN